jgi:hypothetical protein
MGLEYESIPFVSIYSHLGGMNPSCQLCQDRPNPRDLKLVNALIGRMLHFTEGF